MAKFDFYLDRKVTAWMREHHLIEAETAEEARQKMIDNFIDNIFLAWHLNLSSVQC